MVSIDMKIPSCCMNCRLLGREEMYCSIYPRRDLDVITVATNRPDWCPLIEVGEHRVGTWIKYNTVEKFNIFGDRVKVSSYRCSECGRSINDISEDEFTNDLQDYPYCHCGAEMRGEKDEQPKHSI